MVRYDPILSLIDTAVASTTDDTEYLEKAIRNYARMIGMDDMKIDVPSRLFLCIMENPIFSPKLAKMMMLEIPDLAIKKSLIEQSLRKKMRTDIFMEMYNLFPKSELSSINPGLIMNGDIPSNIKLDYLNESMKGADRSRLPYICHLAVKSNNVTREMLEAICNFKDGINLSKHTEKMLEEKLCSIIYRKE